MRILLLLLIPFASFAQTGKVASNGTVTVRYETIAGITSIIIQNNSQLESVIEYEYNGLFHSVTLPWGRSVNFKTMDAYFLISARNITDLSSGSQWLDVDSRVRACEIKAIKSARLLTKIECNEIRLTTPAPIVLH